MHSGPLSHRLDMEKMMRGSPSFFASLSDMELSLALSVCDVNQWQLGLEAAAKEKERRHENVNRDHSE